MNLEELLSTITDDQVDTSLIASALAGRISIDTTANEAGYTALHEAVISGKKLLVKALLEKGANINAQAKTGETPLILAILQDPVAFTVIELLLDRGANREIQVDEETALSLSVYDAHYPEIVQLLLSKGARTDNSYIGGDTILHIAVRSGSEIIVKLLLDHGVKPDVKNNRGETPLLIAVENISIHVKMVEVLLQYGAYNRPDAKADPRIRRRLWMGSLHLPENSNNFYTHLLLSGIRIPEEKVLSTLLQRIKARIEETVAAWLAPLELSLENIAAMTPDILRALPQLIQWLEDIKDARVSKWSFWALKQASQTAGNKELSRALKEHFPVVLQDSKVSKWGLLAFWVLQEAERADENQELFQAMQQHTPPVPVEVVDLIRVHYMQKTLFVLLTEQLIETYALDKSLVKNFVKAVTHHLATATTNLFMSPKEVTLQRYTLLQTLHLKFQDSLKTNTTLGG